MNEMNFKVLPNIMLALQFTLVKRKGKTKMYIHMLYLLEGI